MFGTCLLFFLLTILKQTVSDNNCVCVPFWKCDDNDDTSDELFDTFDLRSGCKGHFDVCCKIKCGQRKTDNLPFADVTRILGKENQAGFGEFPWMLGVLYGNIYRCGASLIHPKVALTAAHCVDARGIYKIRAGEWDWDSTKEPLRHQDRTARKVIIHPKYEPRSLINDIALIILESAFQLTDHIGVVCLPKQGTMAPPTSDCVVTGWGKTSYNSPKHQPILNHAVLPLVNTNDCTKALQRVQFGPLFRLHKSFICAGGGNSKDTCKGDGGSPLVCNIHGEVDRYEQVGIVSWGLVCGLTDCPGIYVNVALFIDWIDRHMKNHNFNMPYKE